MRASKLVSEFKAVQRESRQVAAELGKALSRCLVEPPSPEQGGFVKPPFPSGPRSDWATLRADNVTDRRHLTLPG